MTVTSRVPRAPGHRGDVRRPWLLVAVELLTSAAGVYGGVGLLAGNVIGMPDGWLSGTPFTSWTLPGVFLLLVVAAPMGIAAGLELRRSAWAAAVSVAAGAALIGWIGVELLVFQRYNVLQPAMLGVGLAVLLLTTWAHRREAMLPAERLDAR
jgi:hypothetical protein